MTTKKIRRVSAQEGYDRWSETYDQTPNPVVRMDGRHTIPLLAPRPRERILDVGCGTGRHFAAMLAASSHAFGLDFSAGMLRIARRRSPGVPLVVADLQRQFPVRGKSFDAVLCALVGEHLKDLHLTFREMYEVLRPGGRLVFSVYHPEMAAAGIEANFQQEGVEFRLGAHRHTEEDYVNALDTVGFAGIQTQTFRGDDELVSTLPKARKYLGFPILLVLQAQKEKP